MMRFSVLLAMCCVGHVLGAGCNDPDGGTCFPGYTGVDCQESLTSQQQPAPGSPAASWTAYYAHRILQNKRRHSCNGFNADEATCIAQTDTTGDACVFTAAPGCYRTKMSTKGSGTVEECTDGYHTKHEEARELVTRTWGGKNNNLKESANLLQEADGCAEIMRADGMGVCPTEFSITCAVDGPRGYYAFKTKEAMAGAAMKEEAAFIRSKMNGKNHVDVVKCSYTANLDSDFDTDEDGFITTEEMEDKFDALYTGKGDKQKHLLDGMELASSNSSPTTSTYLSRILSKLEEDIFSLERDINQT